MSRLQTLQRLKWADWALLLRAFRTVCLVRLGLCILPFRVMRQRIACMKAVPLPTNNPPTPARIAWAVMVTSRVVPGATCLTQALAAHILLTRAGYHGILHIGVAFNSADKLQAHAWLECQGVILIGAGGMQRFTPLPPIEVKQR
ncbi:MAG: lasso peptide biosynthesis B2 protein [Armatimonadota bacterium]